MTDEIEFDEEQIASQYDIEWASLKILSAHAAIDEIGGVLSHPTDEQQAVLTLSYFIREELKRLICTSDKHYAKERAIFANNTAAGVTFLTGLAVGKYGVSPQAAGAIVGAICLMVGKIGIRAWCASIKATELSKKEMDALAANKKSKP